MIKASSLSSGARTQHVFDWVSIIWLISAVSAVGEAVELKTIPKVVAKCGDNVTLTCEFSSSHELEIMLFSWVGRNKTLCKHDSQPDPEVLCQTTNHELSLTLINLMPVDEGKYLCKLRSKAGANSNSSLVKVQDCLGSSGSFINESHAECWFNGVYPNGTVHWFQGDANLTESASKQENKNRHGQYNIISTINVQKGNLPYSCSLWIPEAGKYLSRAQLPMVKENRSSGSIVKLQWICMMVEIMMVKFMM